MTGALWRSAFVAAVFAIHPLHVESVAWIAERRDVLSGLFFMLTLGAYAGYARHSQSLGRYLIDGVDIDGDGDAVAAGDFGGAGDGGGIVAVDVEQTGAGDHVVGDLLGEHLEGIVAPPKDGALAGGTVDEDVGGLIGTALADHHMIEIDAGALEAFQLDAAAEIVADGADVLGAQA